MKTKAKRSTAAEVRERDQLIAGIREKMGNKYVSIATLAVPYIPEQTTKAKYDDFLVKLRRTWQGFTTNPDAVAVLKKIDKGLKKHSR